MQRRLLDSCSDNSSSGVREGYKKVLPEFLCGIKNLCDTLPAIWLCSTLPYNTSVLVVKYLLSKTTYVGQKFYFFLYYIFKQTLDAIHSLSANKGWDKYSTVKFVLIKLKKVSTLKRWYSSLHKDKSA